jgi:hypothetical protein
MILNSPVRKSYGPGNFWFLKITNIPAGMESGFREIIPDACRTGVTAKLPWLVRRKRVCMDDFGGRIERF